MNILLKTLLIFFYVSLSVSYTYAEDADDAVPEDQKDGITVDKALASIRQQYIELDKKREQNSNAVWAEPIHKKEIERPKTSFDKDKDAPFKQGKNESDEDYEARVKAYEEKYGNVRSDGEPQNPLNTTYDVIEADIDQIEKNANLKQVASMPDQEGVNHPVKIYEISGKRLIVVENPGQGTLNTQVQKTYYLLDTDSRNYNNGFPVGDSQSYKTKEGFVAKYSLGLIGTTDRKRDILGRNLHIIKKNASGEIEQVLEDAIEQSTPIQYYIKKQHHKYDSSFAQDKALITDYGKADTNPQTRIPGDKCKIDDACDECAHAGSYQIRCRDGDPLSDRPTAVKFISRAARPNFIELTYVCRDSEKVPRTYKEQYKVSALKKNADKDTPVTLQMLMDKEGDPAELLNLLDWKQRKYKHCSEQPTQMKIENIVLDKSKSNPTPLFDDVKMTVRFDPYSNSSQQCIYSGGPEVFSFNAPKMTTPQTATPSQPEVAGAGPQRGRRAAFPTARASRTPTSTPLTEALKAKQEAELKQNKCSNIFANSVCVAKVSCVNFQYNADTGRLDRTAVATQYENYPVVCVASSTNACPSATQCLIEYLSKKGFKTLEERK